ncbi:MAG: hypothetical protein PHV59_10605 [Victivallales bacterium]|nr:hypothetical protein [Victivallales bacterium]
MNSSNQSPLFPAGTLMVAYKGEALGGAWEMPQWRIEAVIAEKRYFRSPDIEAEVAVTNSINMEFEALNPDCSGGTVNIYRNPDTNFGNEPGELMFLPLDPENRLAFYFPRAVLKGRKAIKGGSFVHWKFEILLDGDGVFMSKLKTEKQIENSVKL